MWVRGLLCNVSSSLIISFKYRYTVNLSNILQASYEHKKLWKHEYEKAAHKIFNYTSVATECFMDLGKLNVLILGSSQYTLLPSCL